MFGRATRTKLPQLEDTDKNYDIVNKHDTNKKETMKVYADKKRNEKISEIKIGDMVYMKQKVNMYNFRVGDPIPVIK